MRLVAITILLAVVSLARSQKSEISAKDLESAPAPVKLDKNLRQALLKALTELEAASAEQRKDDDDKSLIMTIEKTFEDVVKKNLNANVGVIPKASFSFDGFPGDEEIPNEEKLQNSSSLESKRYVSPSPMIIEKASRDDARSFHVHNVIVPDKNPSTYLPRGESKVDSLEARSLKSSGSASVNRVQSVTLKPITQVSESLTQSASNGIANANALVTPKPTASSPTVSPKNNVTTNKDKSPAEEVKIFQAPLVAAFTVQQDELGIPKSVVPIYRQSGDGQALTLQEQLEFKQKLLEQQLAELQQQQIQQTQFLIRQRQLYEQQLRQKQQQQYLQEQARIKQLEEQAKIKQLEEQRLKQLEEQRIYRLHQHNHFPLQKQHIFQQQTNVLPLQSSLQEPAVHLQPSVSLELPNAAAPPLFRTNYQEQLQFQQFRQQPQQQQQQQQQQRLQQNFVSFPTDFQPPVASATRFNRQEAFNAVGNFGFNLDNKQPPPSRNTFNFAAPTRAPSTFIFNPYTQFNQIPTRGQQTPAKQIQHLLYQSGVVGKLGNVQGPGAEDLNIVSKVLALNVGALPNKNYQFVNNRSKLGSA
ncbi:alpha-protein kinase 1-like [Nylanderia fulva]|uniref:alpha-protein kinase 1-like n=1 Tax=Nylanderia fulva TaxID=613905 RepID=UPI0010FB5D04|nr:alpha-protein kinase 1-like [Nylanderia fulva]